MGHGRIETRTVRASSDIEWLKEQYPQWTGLKSIVAVSAKREYNGKITEDTRTSLFNEIGIIRSESIFILHSDFLMPSLSLETGKKNT